MSHFFIHANAHELNVLDALQGFSQLVDGNQNIRMYTNGFEKLMRHPQALRAVLDYGRMHYSKGGRVGVEPLSSEELEMFRHYGRHGDDCVAVVGPYTLAVLQTFARHKNTINPHTGLPEFFSLGGLFDSLTGGLSKIFDPGQGGGLGGMAAKFLNPITAAGGIFSPVMAGLASPIHKALSSIVGPNAMNAIQSMGGNLIKTAGEALPALGQLGGNVLGGAVGARFGGPAGATMGAQLGNSLGGALGNMVAPVVNQFGQSLTGAPQPGAEGPVNAGHTPAATGPNPFVGAAQALSQGASPTQAAQQHFMPYAAQQAQQGAEAAAGPSGLHPLVSQALSAFHNYSNRMTGQPAPTPNVVEQSAPTSMLPNQAMGMA